MRTVAVVEQERRLIEELAGRASKGEKEKGYLLSEDDGVLLDEKEADEDTPYEVDFPAQKAEQAERENRRLTYVHSHEVVSPPSELDWGLFVDFPALVRFVAVCEDRFFVLERTAATNNPFRVNAQTIFLLEQNVLVKKSSVGTLPLKKALQQVPANELLDLLRAVNRKLAQTYGVRFKEQNL